jgi:SAM-dependent methyltransferase
VSEGRDDGSTRAAPKPERLNVGCGRDVRPGWVNLDVAPLPGVDVVHDLASFPWPFTDGQFERIELIHVLEHLPDTVAAMNELHRIARPGGRVTVRVPYWNSPDSISDPTHRRFFNEHTFDFFDPGRRHGQERSYYATARFSIKGMRFYTRVIQGLPYLPVSWAPLRAVLSFLARFLGGVIWAEEVELEALKPRPDEEARS